ncbi:hypothetical protein ACFL9T_07270 [Thermodesulfobacteriota bacterium]
MKNFVNVSPLKILEKASQSVLGRGNLGVLIARPGVGKTACLINIGFDNLLQEKKLVHVSLEDSPEKVTSYYNVIMRDFPESLQLTGETQMKPLLEKNRMIMAYLNQSFEIRRLRDNLKNLTEKIAFTPDAIIVDGLDFSRFGKDIFHEFKEMASEFQVEMWFSALSHSNAPEAEEEGFSYLEPDIEDLFSVMIQLSATQNEITLRLLKDHQGEVTSDLQLKLDARTFLALP